MKTPIFIFTAFLVSINVHATDLKISKPILYTDDGQSYAVLNLSWDNAWHNQINNDAVWIFFKFLKGTRGYNHVKVNTYNHLVVSNHTDTKLELGIEVPNDRLGLYIFPKENFRGHVNVTLKIFLDTESLKDINTRTSNFTAYAIEMVKIPNGSFVLGDSDPSALKFGSVYKSDSNGNYDGLFKVTEEKQSITIAPTKGNLYYQAPEGYEGDQNGVIPPAFPKGVQGFYIMKYEPTEGQYVDFLNSLNEYQSQNRANFGGKSYYSERGSITIKNGKYVTDNNFKPCNHMSWDDAMAFADWSCLRPMTELEFTKASRGPVQNPLGIDFPWGSNSKDQLQRMVAESGNLEMLNGMSEAELTTKNKALFGASYYWVMDLSGSLWERMITIGDDKGRSFIGTHGDGNLSNYGFATNEDWPKGIEETGGYGFRGGGFYGYGRDYHDFNPYSPISYRPYGGWSGGNRTNAYGARFVRTSN
ncbi:SUMF1/EgtB/PvdO family nonheme iron enzyme [uncultured Psychroserpens sp.]|uniref:SUMF1/EgtB/PvdO family nonheme iron enzyme n=1 Tax=uncultured Psychroserpens sp. TaxID=255436 RepID=UPI00260CE615|nr:SUMF1/EgtB/PvdO family nonheme iron enzyme [uncultured Psychroserpens sp.]